MSYKDETDIGILRNMQQNYNLGTPEYENIGQRIREVMNGTVPEYTDEETTEEQ